MPTELLSTIWRLIGAAMIAICGMGLLAASYEVLGLGTLLLSFLVVIPRATEVVFLVVFGLIHVACLALVFWIPYGVFGGESILSWMSEYWWIPTFYVVVMLYGVVDYFSSRESTWDILRETYGAESIKLENLRRLSKVSGVMELDEDTYIVDVYGTSTGLYIAWRDRGSLLIPWGRIRESRPSSDDMSKAEIYLKTQSGMLRPITVPWSRALQFRTQVDGVGT